jgi:hypothetical protein
LSKRYITLALSGLCLLGATTYAGMASASPASAKSPLVPVDITPYAAPTIAVYQATPIAVDTPAPTIAVYHATPIATVRPAATITLYHAHLIQPFYAQKIQPWTAPPIAAYHSHIIPMYVAPVIKPVYGHLIAPYTGHGTPGSVGGYGGFVPVATWNLPPNASSFAVAEVAVSYATVQNFWRDPPPYPYGRSLDGASPDTLRTARFAGALAGTKPVYARPKPGLYYRMVLKARADASGRLNVKIPFHFRTRVPVTGTLIVETFVKGKPVARQTHFTIKP